MPSTKCGFDSIPGGASGQTLLVAYGPTLNVDIGFDATFTPIQSHPPTASEIGVHALVDTGASESCIDGMLATQLNLPIVDKRPIAGVHGSKEVNVYLAQIRVPSLGRTIYGAFAGVDLAASGQIHKALIGRTFLQHLTMVYEGRAGTVTLSS
jgi:predicted aspartyl protease